jgi:putative ABC transport system permease protein
VRLAGFLTRRGRDDWLRDELQFHREMLESDLLSQGFDPESARREARLRLGGRRQIEEAWADQRSLPAFESVGQDVRYALRTFVRAPGFAAAALATLALGIGANTAIVSVVHSVLLRPLPFANPDRLVVWGDREPDGSLSNVGYTTFHDIRERARAFDSLAVVRSWSPTLSIAGEAERVPAMRVSWNYFSMLGVTPALGRGFRPDEDAPERWRVLILSDQLWRRRFGGDPGVVGRTVRMNDRDYQIVGVMAPDFERLISAQFYQPAEMWAPVGYDTSLPDACRTCQHLKGIGRVREGLTLNQAVADLNAIRVQLEAEHPSEYAAAEMGVSRLHQVIAGPVRPALIVLLGAVAFVLLIACANVANLLLARAVNRSREMAIRAALGAGRGRLARQLLTESLLLGLAGGTLGVGVAAGLLRSISTIAPVAIPRMDHASIDVTALGFVLVVSIVVGLLFGLVPAVRGSAAGLIAGTIADARTVVGGRVEHLRHLLVVADLALALVLLAGAGLMIETVARLMRVDPGFNPAGVLTLQFSLVGEAYREDAAVVTFQQQVLEGVRALPGVEEVALAGQIPLGGNHDTWGFHIEGRVFPNPAEAPSVERYSVTPDYFRLMEIPLLRGRLFTDSDRPNASPVLLLSETTAKSLWGGEDPIGQRVRVPGVRSPLRTVVGIVGDVHHYRLDETARPQMYLPQSQVTDSFLVLTVRSNVADPSRLTASIRSVLRSLDPAVPVYEVANLSDLVSRSYAARRFVLLLLTGFAGIALLLAAIGLYGVVSYTVLQRTREVGLRIALGARPADILRMVFGSGLRTIVAGLITGLLGALILTRFLESLLFGVQPSDAATHAGAIFVLVVVTAAAHLIPLRRALRIDPAVALRHD